MNLKVAFVFWIIMVLIAIANGFFGQFVMTRFLGDYGSHLYRTFFAVAVIFIASHIYVRYTGIAGIYAPAVLTGLFWAASSLTFEFGFGHYVFKLPWEKITSEYDISNGRLWSLVIISEALSPFLNAFIFKP